MSLFRRAGYVDTAAQQAVEQSACQLVTAVRKMATGRERLVAAHPADFPGYDAAFYDGVERELGAVGFRGLGDFADAKVGEKPPEKRGFYRMALTDDGTVVASWFVVPGAPPRDPLNCVVLNTWLEDGRACTTMRGGLDSAVPRPPHDLLRLVEPNTTVADVLRVHRETVAAAAGTPKCLGGVQDVLAAREADQAMVREFRLEQGLRLFEPMLRKKLGDEYQERGVPLLEAILRHPEWWTDEPEAEPAAKAVDGGPAPHGDGRSGTHPGQLGIPPDVLADSQAYELARVWTAQDHQYFVLDVTRFPEPGVWGLMALDLMKQAARAYQQLDGRSKEDTYKQILMGFMAEMQDPTEPL